MKWFGTDAWAPICDTADRVDIPVGATCAHCNEPIGAGDSGMVIPHLDEQGGSERPWHWECHLRTVVGGLNHLRGTCTCTCTCTCTGGAEPPDPPWLNTRQAAIVAASVWEGMRRAPR